MCHLDATRQLALLQSPVSHVKLLCKGCYWIVWIASQESCITLLHVAKMHHVGQYAGIHTVDPPLHVPVPAAAKAKIKEAYVRHYIANPPMAEKLERAVASEPAPYKKPL